MNKNPLQSIITDHTAMIAYLKESRSLSRLPEHIISQLLELGNHTAFPAEKTILHQNSESDRFYFLLTGTVSVYSKGVVVAKLKRRGDIFGEMSVIGDHLSPVSVVADTEVNAIVVETCKIGSVDSAESGTFESHLMRFILRFLAEKLSITNQTAAQFEIINRRLVETQPELERIQQAFEKANQAKTDFLTLLSHEIRTPLNAISGNIELLFYTDLTPEQKRFATSAYKSGELLLATFNNILDYMKIEAGELQLRNSKFDLQAAIEELEEMFIPEASAKGLELILEVDSRVSNQYWGDGVRLRQVISILIGNAIKFTEQGKVWLVLNVEEILEGAQQLMIKVRDTGVGIPSDKLGLIFEMFTQADASSTRRYGGLGLGLAISNYLVRAMGGKMEVESTLEKGSNFWFTLTIPIAKSEST
jgi:signal transduction histidine kinase